MSVTTLRHRGVHERDGSVSPDHSVCAVDVSADNQSGVAVLAHELLHALLQRRTPGAAVHHVLGGTMGDEDVAVGDQVCSLRTTLRDIDQLVGGKQESTNKRDYEGSICNETHRSKGLYFLLSWAKRNWCPICAT